MTIRVAICDDHPFFRTGLSGVLRAEEDLDVLIEAGSIDELSCGLENVDVDVILLDVELPDQSGLDALPELAAARNVVMLSAFDDPRRVRRAMQAGALGFLRKDAAPREVIKGIRDAFAGKTVLSAELAISLAEAMRADPDEREFRRRIEAFTPRQREVLELIAEGNSNREIADKLFLSEGTVKNHVTNLLQALSLPDRTRLAILANRYGIGG